MSKNTLLLIIGLSCLAAVLGWNYVKKPFAHLGQMAETTQLNPSPAPPPSDSTAVEVQKIIDRLTPEQKIAQLMAAPVTVSDKEGVPSVWSDWIAQRQPGLITFFGSKLSQQTTTQAIANLENVVLTATGSAQVPVLFAVDHEGGAIQRFNGDGFTTLPSWQVLCALPATQSGVLLEKSATELNQVGIDIVFAPVADVASNSLILNARICSAQPTQVVSANLQAIKAYQAHRVLPVVKHFPGIGSIKKDLHTSFDSITVTPEQALVFHQILKEAPTVGVMVSHVGVENQYKDIPCSLSAACVQELAQTYPSVLIFSDALEMVSARHVVSGAPKPLDQIAKEAIMAGNDVLVWGPMKEPAVLELVTAKLTTEYQQNPGFKVRVDASLRKVLMYKQQRKL